MSHRTFFLDILKEQLLQLFLKDLYQNLEISVAFVKQVKVSGSEDNYPNINLHTDTWWSNDLDHSSFPASGGN